MKTIPLTQGKVALVDDADYEAVSQFKWNAVKNGRRFYAARCVKKPDGKWATLYLHRFLLPDADRVDHKDGDGLNNQRYNIRVATHQENNKGFKRKRVVATSRFRGVSWHKQAGKWAAKIQIDGKSLYLGLFALETDAARAFDAAARKYRGEFAHLNFPII